MNKRILPMVFLILQIVFLSTPSMTQSWQWAQQIGSPEYDWVIGNCDKQGNVYVGGSFQGYYCKFSDTVLYINGQHFNSIFLAKYNNQGEMQWVRQIAYGTGEYTAPGFTDIITDDDGFVYVTGAFSNSAIFGSFVLQSFGMLDIFIAKYSPDGTCIWAHRAGSAKDDYGKTMAIDSLKNVYISGSNNETALFGTNSIIKGGFIAKYDSSGNCMWAKNKIKYNTGWQCPDLVITGSTIFQNNLFGFGFMQNDTISIDSILIIHNDIGGVILCCYDLSANIKWVKEGIGNSQSGYNIATDTMGNIFITGLYVDSINFDGTILKNSKKHQIDAFCCKYNPQGTILWSHQAKASGAALGKGIIPDSEGSCYVTGSFTGTAFPEVGNITSETELDLFLAKYDPEGSLIGVNHFGKAQGKRVGFDNASNPFVIGEFFGNVEIGATSLSSYGDWDIFIASSDKITNFVQPKYQQEDHLVISANPTTGKCNITIPDAFLNEKSLTLTIYDNQGKVVYSTTFNLSEDKIRLNLSAYAEGIYTAVLTNGKKTCTGRIVFAGNR